MADYPKNLKYTKDHEWARKDGAKIVVGVTAHAQEALGDVVYVELPKVGAAVTAGKQFGVVESTKAVSELYSPVTGKVSKVNDALTKEPSAINSDCYGAGWIIEIEASGAEYDALLDADAYSKLLAEQK
jgi:glycine cleavage system H protein